MLLKLSKLTHFHIPVDDMARAKRFYSEVFGWNIEATGSAFQIMRTVPVDELGVPKEPGATYGALYKRQRPHDAPSLVIEVPSIDDAIPKVKAAGGKLVTPKGLVGLFGLLAEITDSEGNLIGIFENVNGSKDLSSLFNR